MPADARPESAIIAEILRRHHAVPDTAILIEYESTNCCENAKLSVELLKLTPWKVPSILLIQDPTMLQRTRECFRHSLTSSFTVPIAEPWWYLTKTETPAFWLGGGFAALALVGWVGVATGDRNLNAVVMAAGWTLLAAPPSMPGRPDYHSWRLLGQAYAWP